MGEVYRAKDTELDREVAVKVLLEAVAQDPDRIARFEREARLLASLSHQNIATLHGLEEHEGRRYLVMELAEGETLAERLNKGPLPADEALEIALQIANGLEAAHEAGIVHRDLKPANVMLSPGGKVKLLDFGLAKAWQAEEGDSDLTHSPTLTAQMTAGGVLLGTAAYMSPEQARGKLLDSRTDIWAFGCVLYEMLTGEKPFRGETVTDVLAAVLTFEPDWESLPETTAPAVRHLLRRCLQKVPNRRLHSIADARIEIEDAVSEPPPPHGSPPVSDGGNRRNGMSRGAAVALALVSAIVGGGLVAGILEDASRSEKAVPRSPQPVVFLMDTLAPRGVYDPETLHNSGTNADDLNDLLRDLPVVLHKETLGSTWDREDQILKQRPDLIVIHRSALFHSINLELGFGYPPFDDPEHQARVERIYAVVDGKLMAFFGYVALGDPQTKFLVYSRGAGEGWIEEQQVAWVAEIERRYPPLQGRVFTMRVPRGPDGASFRDPVTGRMIRERVVALLGLSESDQEQLSSASALP
jgi:serine/threonine protein kinase